ncbi:MAG: hypothetical protein JW751_01965 [Polyangiaceae bacterium]|nr:hypothetical protein [Polyangiaceae bacterium]
MRLLELDFTLPERFTATITGSDLEGTCIDIVGDQADSLAGSIVKTAEDAGFVIAEHAPGRTELARGEQRLLLLFDSSALTLQTHDPTGLPMARTDGAAVLIGDFRVDCGSAAIVPLRERHTGDPRWLRAAWKLSGISAPEVVGRVIDQAVASKGLVRGAIFDPPKGGGKYWSGEAYSDVELVKVRATVESGHVLLEVDLVDKRRRVDPGFGPVG